MLFYSSEARKNAISNIQDLREKVSMIPGNVLSFNDAERIIRYLSMLSTEIEKEEKARKTAISFSRSVEQSCMDNQG